MSKKLFIGGISFNTTDQGLQDFFANYGPVVSVKIITDKFTGRSKGFAFVELGDDQQADKAITELDGATLDGRQIKVSEARPMEPKQGGYNNGGGYNRNSNRY